ncbi:MAG: TolC family outer membrane protein [Methylovulum sp.]|nr:TolC family outer membrane protein [Methylovulum sp.]
MRRTLLLLLIPLSLTAQADDLLSLYSRAVESSPALNSSEYALEIAKAQEDQAFGKLLPEVSLMGNYSLNQFHSKGSTLSPEVSSNYPGTRANISLQQPLFDLQAYLLVKSQQSRTSQGEESLLAAHQKLISDLIERYVDALEATDKTQIIAAELSSTEQQLTRVKAMQARQMALITDLYELEARTETLRTELIDSDNDARIALEKLRELTGNPVTHLQPARLDATQLAPEGSVESWVQQAGQLNPELQALRHAVESARQRISAYQAGHLPRIELQLSETYSDTSYNNRQSPAFDIGTAAVQATLPIYEGGATSARVREAEARKRLSEAELEEKLRELEKLTRAAYLDMATSPARCQATDRQLSASEKSRDAMKKGYGLGVVTIVDLLDAEKQLSEARRIQRQARYRYFKARSALFYQAGRLIGTELAQFNGWLVSAPPAMKNN